MTFKAAWAVLFLLLAVRFAAAQCDPRWISTFNRQGFNNSVTASATWDPDGASGPGAPRMVVAGLFTEAGPVAVPRLVAVDGPTWSALPGIAPSPIVRELVTTDQGELLVLANVGLFRYNGSSWTTLHLSSGAWSCVAFRPDGRMLYSASFGAVTYLYEYNGSAWTALPVSNGVIRDMLVVPGGDVLAVLESSDTPTVSAIARLSGGVLVPTGPVFAGSVRHLEMLPDGRLVAAGAFSSIGSVAADNVAVGNGIEWAELGGGVPFEVQKMMIGEDGVIAVSGPAGAAVPIAKWDGTDWTMLPLTALTEINTLSRWPDGRLFAGGQEPTTGIIDRSRAYLWDGQEWDTPLPHPQVIDVTDAHVRADGLLYAKADFESYVRRIARWDGAQWQSVTAPRVQQWGWNESSVAAVSDDEIYVTDFDGLSVWDGAGWSTYNDHIYHNVAVDSSGRAIVSGDFRFPEGIFDATVAVLDNGVFTQLPKNTDHRGWATESVVDASGTIYAIGPQTIGPLSAPQFHSVVMFDGAGSQGLPVVHHGIVDAAIDAQGRLVVIGAFIVSLGGQTAKNIVRWTGAEWEGLGNPFNPGASNGSDLSVCIGSDNEIYAWLRNGLIAYDGQSWRFVFGSADIASRPVRRIRAHPSGEILLFGDILQGQGQLMAGFARYTLTNVPWMARHPDSQSAAPGGPVTISATAASGYNNLIFQWQRETAPGSGVWVDLDDGPGGASPGGGRVINSSGAANGGEEILLSISGIAVSDAGAYRCVVSNACGQVESRAAEIAVTNPCRPDLTTGAVPGTPGYGVPDGVLNNDDFFYFLAQFAAGNAAVADLTTSAVAGSPGYGVPNGVINNDDFFYYLGLFAAGC